MILLLEDPGEELLRTGNFWETTFLIFVIGEPKFVRIPPGSPSESFWGLFFSILSRDEEVHCSTGKTGIDPFTLAKLIANTCGNLAHVFLSVVFFSSLYWFIFFKEQNYIHVILPTEDQEILIKNYVISIFALKVNI